MIRVNKIQEGQKLAALTITKGREVEKDKLTMINLEKGQRQQEEKYLKDSYDREMHKSQSTAQLKQTL